MPLRVFSSSLPPLCVFLAQPEKGKKKPRGTGAFLAPNLRGLSFYLVVLGGEEGFSLPLREFVCPIRERVNWKIAPATATRWPNFLDLK
jgi:hypothetical protein